VADEEDLLLAGIGGVCVPPVDMVQPAEIDALPFAALAVERTAGTAAGQVHVVGQVGHFPSDTHFELVACDAHLAPFPEGVQDVAQASHALVGDAFVEVEDGDAQCPTVGCHNAQR
jgi:hypothetical protein